MPYPSMPDRPMNNITEWCPEDETLDTQWGRKTWRQYLQREQARIESKGRQTKIMTYQGTIALCHAGVASC